MHLLVQPLLNKTLWKHETSLVCLHSYAGISVLNTFDNLGVQNLFNVKMLFDARMHLGHTVRSLNPQMNKWGTIFCLRAHQFFRRFVFGSRFEMCVVDLDQTALHLRQALNFTAHIAYRWDHLYSNMLLQTISHFVFRGGIILFVCRQPSLIHMVDRFEYSYPLKVELQTCSGQHRSVGSSVLHQLGQQRSLQHPTWCLVRR